MSAGNAESTTAKWSRGNWMQTYTGQRFYPLMPEARNVEPLDIAHALAMQCRYNGHVDRFYSVAEHCVLMSHAVPAEDALWALLHDAAETYVGDMVRPLKQHLPLYRDIEDVVLAAVAERFGLVGHDLPASVKDADNRILLTERAALMANTRYDWAVDGLDPLPVTIHGWSPQEAEERYMARLVELRVDHLLGASS